MTTSDMNSPFPSTRRREAARRTAWIWKTVAAGALVAAGVAAVGQVSQAATPSGHHAPRLHVVALSKKTPSFVLSADVNPASAGQPITFSVVSNGTLSQGDPQHPVFPPLGTIELISDGQQIATATLAQRVSGSLVSSFATFPAVTLPAGSHTVYVDYPGDDNYAAASTADMPLTEVVTIAQTSTSLVASPPMPHGTAKVALTATVTSNGGTPTGSVEFSLVGSAKPFVTVPLNASGRATWATQWMLAFGSSQRSVVATYLGSAGFAGSSSAPTTVAPTCDTVVTGAHAGLTISSGTTCIAGATISGSIMVAKGASVVIDHSSVSGPVMTSNAGGVRICGSSTANVTVTGSTGLVVIGSSENLCAANTVKGSLTVTKNSGGVVVVGNTVTGTVTASKNTGAGPFTDQKKPVISGNHP